MNQFSIFFVLQRLTESATVLLIDPVPGIIVDACDIGEGVLVFGSTGGVALITAAIDVLFEPAACLVEDMGCRIHVSVDCQRTWIISAHTVALVIVVTLIVVRLGLCGIAPLAWADRIYVGESPSQSAVVENTA
jgi:hypothetical protein